MSSRILHDLICKDCEAVRRDVVVINGDYPHCTICKGEMTWMPSKVSTDLFATPQFSDATGEWHSSQSEKIKRMKEIGVATTGVPYTEAGDKVHGARNDLSIKRSAFSFSGQKSRVSTEERYGGS
jgi:hypothetical protein